MVRIKGVRKLLINSPLELREQPLNDSIENAQKYVNSDFENTYFLGYRDIPHFLGKYTLGKRAIDYGCGTGRSTRFLKANGFEAIGVDVSNKMLEQAIIIDPISHYLQIKSAEIPVIDSSCDLILSCFVLLQFLQSRNCLQFLKKFIDL
ncbi:MAG: class I SAM-dependent methyltransferase [Rhabdochlamydiaceae bacterium]